MYGQETALKGYASANQICADTANQGRVDGLLASLHSSISEALVCIDHLEVRLGICLRIDPATPTCGSSPQAVPESELIGQLDSIGMRLDSVGSRVRQLTNRVTL